MTKQPNIAASVKARLLNIAKEQQQPFDVVLIRYALERLIYRLGISPFAERYIHIIERRERALEDLLEEIASLDRLRRLVAGLRNEEMAGTNVRVAEFLELAERKLASREAAVSADGLEQRFEKQKLFGDDDDHAFEAPRGFY